MTRMARIRPLLVALLAPACATLAGNGQGDLDLPSMASGPFRLLKHCLTDADQNCITVNELPPATGDGFAKYAQTPPSHSPAALVRGSGVGNDLGVVLFVEREGHALASTSTIARMEAPDARSFEGPDDVVPADDPALGTRVSAPCAIDGSDGGVWLYFSRVPTSMAGIGALGIFRARSTDGRVGKSFSLEPTPVLAFDPSATGETTAPSSPAVIAVPSGYRMFYQAGSSIFEAESTDGRSWKRRAGGAVLGPNAMLDPATLPRGVHPNFDERAVADPWAERVISPAGRVIVRVFYTGIDRNGWRTIGMAARFGDDGPMIRNEGPTLGQPGMPDAGPVFGSTKITAHAPTIARFPSFALLYADTPNSDSPPVDQVAVAISPVTTYLPIGK